MHTSIASARVCGGRGRKASPSGSIVLTLVEARWQMCQSLIRRGGLRMRDMWLFILGGQEVGAAWRALDKRGLLSEAEDLRGDEQALRGPQPRFRDRGVDAGQVERARGVGRSFERSSDILLAKPCVEPSPSPFHRTAPPAKFGGSAAAPSPATCPVAAWSRPRLARPRLLRRRSSIQQLPLANWSQREPMLKSYPRRTASDSLKLRLWLSFGSPILSPVTGIMSILRLAVTQTPAARSKAT